MVKSTNSEYTVFSLYFFIDIFYICKIYNIHTCEKNANTWNIKEALKLGLKIPLLSLY